MNSYIQNNEYIPLIKKIKRKRTVVIVLTIIAELITLLLCAPIEVVVFDKTMVLNKGINPIFTILIVLGIYICEIFACAIVLTPLTSSMSVECDPKKHLILNDALNKQKNKDYIYAVDLMYMGDFKAALGYANKMIGSNKSMMVNIGLFNKARCEFFLGDFDSLKSTVKQYEIALNNSKNISKKTKATYNKILKTMNLLVAISEEDKNGISNFSSIEMWNKSKATEGYINYLKAIAAYMTENKQEAIYRFMFVKENYEKTIFSQFSQQYLSKLSADS